MIMKERRGQKNCNACINIMCLTTGFKITEKISIYIYKREKKKLKYMRPIQV